jgi:hypothetical protein
MKILGHLLRLAPAWRGATYTSRHALSALAYSPARCAAYAGCGSSAKSQFHSTASSRSSTYAQNGGDVDTIKSLLATNKHGKNNIPPSIIEKVGRNLHLRDSHPLGIIKSK